MYRRSGESHLFHPMVCDQRKLWSLLYRPQTSSKLFSKFHCFPISQTQSGEYLPIYNMRRIRKYLSHQSAISLIHTFITSKLDYCNSLLYGLPTIHFDKLQRVQNAAATLVTNTPHLSYHSHFRRSSLVAHQIQN